MTIQKKHTRSRSVNAKNSRRVDCDKCDSKIAGLAAHVRVGRARFALCVKCAPELFTEAQGGPKPALFVTCDEKTTGDRLVDISGELWDADAMLAHVAVALADVPVGTRKHYKRDARRAILGVTDALLEIANAVNASAFGEIDESDLDKLRSYPARLETLDATLAALCDALEGVGAGRDDERRDPVRVFTRAMAIIGDATRELEDVLDEIERPADHKRMSSIESAKAKRMAASAVLQ